MFDLVSYASNGVFSILLRWLISAGIQLVALARLDRTLDVPWVESIMAFDWPHGSYRAFVVLYHRHNNPVVRAIRRILPR